MNQQRRTLLCSITLGFICLCLCGYGDSMERKATRIVVPELDVEDMAVGEVVKWLRRESKRLDPEHVGVNFFLKLDPRHANEITQREVTLSFRRLSIEEIVRYLCMATGLQYRLEANAVVIADTSVALDKMETRFYHLEPGVLDSKKTRKAKFLKFGDEDDDDD